MLAAVAYTLMQRRRTLALAGTALARASAALRHGGMHEPAIPAVFRAQRLS